MIDWVSIVRHSRRRFSNYVGSRSPVRIRKRRRAPPPHVSKENQYNCCCSNQNQRFKVEGESEVKKTDAHQQQQSPPLQSPSPKATVNNIQASAAAESHHSEQAVSAEIAD